MNLWGGTHPTASAISTCGELRYETVSREAAGTTNLSRTEYVTTYSTADNYRQVTRTEADWDSSITDFADKNEVIYRYDGMNRQSYEKRNDVEGATTWEYEIAQTYDKSYPTRGSMMMYSR